MREHWFFVDFIYNATKQQLKLILSKITQLQLKVICEIAANISAGNIKTHSKSAIPKTFVNLLSKKSISASKKRFKIARNPLYVKHMIESVYPTLKLLYT
jgi:hypothetical protein